MKRHLRLTGNKSVTGGKTGRKNILLPSFCRHLCLIGMRPFFSKTNIILDTVRRFGISPS
jgi:hypothetical protein